jgi:hypothetical protein
VGNAMTKDDIIKLARESGFADAEGVVHAAYQLETFAALVAAAEREAIAQMFEASPELVRLAQNDQGGCIICGLNPKIVVKAVRARGELK